MNEVQPPNKMISWPPPYPPPAVRPVVRNVRSEGITPVFVLHAVRRWWKVAAPVAILLAVVAVGTVAYLFKPTYLAVGRILIHENPPFIAFKTDESTNKKFVKTQLDLLRLPVILRQVLADPEIRNHPEILAEPYPLDYLTSAVRVNAGSDSEIYAIEFESQDPKHAKKVLDAVIASYMTYITSYDSVRRVTLMSSLDDEISKWQQKMLNVSQQLEDLTKETGLRPTATVAGAASLISADETLSNMQSVLVQAEVDVVLLSAELKSEEKVGNKLSSLSAKDVDQVVATELLDRKLALESKRRQIEQLKAANANESSPLIQQQEALQQQEEEAYAKLEEELRLKARARLGTESQNVAELRVEELQWKLATAEATRDIVTAKIAAAEMKGKSEIGDQMRVDFANRDLLQAESTYQLLVQQKAKLSTEENAPSRVTSLEGDGGVSRPEKPIKSLPLTEMLIALAGSLCVPFGLAIGWEWMVKRVNSTEELRHFVGMPIVGEIAVLPSYGYGRSASKRASFTRQLFQESIDGLRTTLMLSDSMHDVQVLAVASAVSSEGKTSVATHLAMSLARTSGKSILLIDGDLRAPDIHRMFDMQSSPGLSEVLTGEASLEDATTSTGFEQLDILPAGSLTTTPHRLLSNGEFSALLDVLRRKYDFVLIDTPPVLAASESLLLANQADGTILCVLRDRTRLSNVREAQMRLEDAGARTVGVVMSGLPVRHYTSRYGSYAYGEATE